MTYVTFKQQKNDLALAGISALLILGVVFFVFSMASWLFYTSEVAWTFFWIGLGVWIFSLGIFFYFMNDPYPRHQRRR